MNVALIQMTIGPDRIRNIEHAAELMDRAVQRDTDLVILPEIFTSHYIQDRFKENGEPVPGGQAHAMLTEKAKKYGVNIIGGSVVEQEADRCFNTCMVLDRKGNLAAVHRKTHLFDVDLPAVKFMESSVFTPGKDLTVVDLDGIRTGIAICFDIRFPEYIRLLALQDAHLIVCPAAFSVTTGSAHWELLLRSRAVDNQVYVAGCSPAADPQGPYPYFGHSMVMDPWGDTVCRAQGHETILHAQIRENRIRSVREKMDLHGLRRKELYGLNWTDAD